MNLLKLSFSVRVMDISKFAMIKEVLLSILVGSLPSFLSCSLARSERSNLPSNVSGTRKHSRVRLVNLEPG